MSRFAFAAAPNINVVFFAETPLDDVTAETADIIEGADLVVALGNVNLEALVAVIPPNKPALCVLGGNDAERQPPAPFRALHGGGVTFKDWRVAGLSGARRLGPGSGFYVDEEESAMMLSEMPSCDLLISHAPPSGLPSSRTGVDPGLDSLRAYLAEKEPIYHFHAHRGNDHVEHGVTSTWVVGVAGMMYPEPLKFL